MILTVYYHPELVGVTAVVLFIFGVKTLREIFF